MNWRFWRRHRAAPPEGLKLLADSSDEEILDELKALPYVLIAKSDEMMRASMLWLVMLQEEPFYDDIAKDILKEIRALDDYVDERGEERTGGVPSFFAYLYYLYLWYNTVQRNPDYRQFSEIANSYTHEHETKDTNRGYG